MNLRNGVSFWVKSMQIWMVKFIPHEKNKWLHLLIFKLLNHTGYVTHRQVKLLKPTGYVTHRQFNLLNHTVYVIHQQFNIQQLYVLPTLYLCVLYLSENKQRLGPLTA